MQVLSTGVFALMVVALTFFIGEAISTLTKAWIPSVFVTAILFLLGYWTFFPSDLIEVAGLGAPLGGTITILLLVVHMGTSLSPRELGKQWKVIVTCVLGLVGMCVFGLFIASRFVDKSYVIAGLPPLSGGITATTMMQQAAMGLGLERVAILALCMFICQGFAGYPLTAFVLKKECKRLLATPSSTRVTEAAQVPAEVQSQRKKPLLPQLPANFQSTSLYLFKTSLVAGISMLLGGATSGWGIFQINPVIFALILGIIFCQLGFLEKDILNKAGVLNFLLFVLLSLAFGGLKNATPDMLTEILVPLFVIIVIGVAGMTVFALLSSKLLKISPYIACATAYTAMYGFPFNYMLTQEAVKAMTGNQEEQSYLMEQIWPQMLVGGFITVTIGSLFIAGMFIPLLGA